MNRDTMAIPTAPPTRLFRVVSVPSQLGQTRRGAGAEHDAQNASPNLTKPPHVEHCTAPRDQRNTRWPASVCSPSLVGVGASALQLGQNLSVTSITFPQSGLEHAAAQPMTVRGHAWAGDREVKAVHVSTDFGATWQEMRLEKPANRFAWQHWTGEVSFPEAGYYEIWARATDSKGNAQPMVLPGWNPKGYLNNACHRIAVQVA